MSNLILKFARRVSFASTASMRWNTTGGAHGIGEGRRRGECNQFIRFQMASFRWDTLLHARATCLGLMSSHIQAWRTGCWGRHWHKSITRWPVLFSRVWRDACTCRFASTYVHSMRTPWPTQTPLHASFARVNQWRQLRNDDDPCWTVKCHVIHEHANPTHHSVTSTECTFACIICVPATAHEILKTVAMKIGTSLHTHVIITDVLNQCTTALNSHKTAYDSREFHTHHQQISKASLNHRNKQTNRITMTLHIR